MINFKPAGTYELKSFLLSSYERGEEKEVDIKAIVHTWDLTESIFKGSIRGTAKIYDATGTFYDFPIRGQEKVKIKYTDMKDVEREHDLFVYAVTDVKPSKSNSDTVLEYVLHFTSYAKFVSDTYTVKRCIANGSGASRNYIPVSEQAQILFDDYYAPFTEQELNAHESDGVAKIVIPDMRPEEAMHLFSRKAYSTTHLSSQFRFFENRDTFNFINMEEHIVLANKDEQKFLYSSGIVDKTPDAELKKMQTIVSIDYGTYANTLEDIQKGTYTRRLNEIDTLSRVQINHEHHYILERDVYDYPDDNSKLGLFYSEDFIRKHMDHPQETYVFKDYADTDAQGGFGLRPRPNYTNIYNRKGSAVAHYNRNRITVEIFGTNELVAGDVIELDIPEFREELQRVDESKSGFYLVETVRNVFFENSYRQILSVSKGAYKKGEIDV